MAEGSAGEKTEKATPRRREEARKKGQVARSQEVNGTLVLLVGISILLMTGGYMSENLVRNARYLFTSTTILAVDNHFGLAEIISENLFIMVKTVAPMLGGILVIGLGANVMQVGFHASTEALNFKLDKLNPITGIKRLFSRKTAFEMFKNVLKIGLLSLIAWWTVDRMMDDLAALPMLQLPGVVDMGRAAFMRLAYSMLFLLAILSVMDWTFQKHRHEEEIKMTLQEVKQEMKDIEGDPQVKARMRGVQFEMARQRMMADVPQADVVVTNPTHLAVALKYERGGQAPVVVAKGRDHVAEKIKSIARHARVPVIENKPVARALFKGVKIGQMVPESLYQAVAEILAYVYRLKRA